MRVARMAKFVEVLIRRHDIAFQAGVYTGRRAVQAILSTAGTGLCQVLAVLSNITGYTRIVICVEVGYRLVAGRAITQGWAAARQTN